MEKKNTVQLTLQSRENNMDSYITFLKKIFKSIGINFKIVNLPKKRKRITLLKSPHVNKKAWEQFETFRFKKIIRLPHNVLRRDLMKILLINKPKFIELSLRKVV
jgi:ribosomal protein S10